METKLARISEISTKRPDTKLSSIGHLINAEMLSGWFRVKRKVEEMLFFWLNRRSQRKSYSWKQYRMLLEVFGLEKTKIYINIYG